MANIRQFHKNSVHQIMVHGVFYCIFKNLHHSINIYIIYSYKIIYGIISALLISCCLKKIIFKGLALYFIYFSETAIRKVV